jgi:WD40 repeat protein/tRNA A-37 threonylcarbamoyl transferase component Bud32
VARLAIRFRFAVRRGCPKLLGVRNRPPEKPTAKSALETALSGETGSGLGPARNPGVTAAAVPSQRLAGRRSMATIDLSDGEEVDIISVPPPLATPPPLPKDRPQPGVALQDARLPTVDRSAYDVGGVFAQGGLGRILKARDVRLNRQVALKEVLTREGDVASRFVREALITARLEHPSIVPVHEAGYWPSGEPFFAMKLVSGRSLSDVMDEAHTLYQRLALLPHLLAVADAIAYAHSERIIHRDLKPANILVGQFGETVVIDWGFAKDLTGEEEPLNKIMGTPAYMPPEQASARPVDERADVYAIGAMLYRTLAGAAPYEGPDGMEIVIKVINELPVPLETRQQGIPEDLLAIVRKAMARDPSDRYPTAKELADDLRRFQTGQIVAAHQYSWAELLARFVRRRRAPLIVAAAGIVALMALGIWSFGRIIKERNFAQQKEAEAQAKQIEAQQKEALAQQRHAEATQRADDLTLSQARGVIDRDPNQAIGWLKTLSAGSPRWRAARTLAADAQARGIARVFRAHSGGINTVAFSPDGGTIATASDDRSVRLWNVKTGESRVLSGHTDEVWCAAFSPDGKLLATGGKDKTLRLWDLATGTAAILPGHQQWLTSIRFSPDGKWITSQGLREGVFLWNVAQAAGKQIAPSSGEEMSRGAVFSPDSSTLAFVEANRLVLWDLASGLSRGIPGQGWPCYSIAFSSDGALVATGATDGTVRLWSTKGGAPSTITGHSGHVTALAFLPNGSALLSGSKDHTVRILDLKTGDSRVLGDYGAEIKTIQLSPDGTQVAAVGQERTVELWDIKTGKGRTLRGFQDWLAFNGVAFSPDGKQLAAAGFDQTMRLWDLGVRIDRVLGEHDSASSFAIVLPDGKRVLSAGEDGTVRLFELGGGKPAILGKHDGKVLDLRLSPDAAWAASAGEDAAVHLFPLGGDRTKPLTLRAHLGRASRVAFSPDGKLLATGGADKKVRLWDLSTRKPKVLFEHDNSVEALAFSPDSQSLASGSADNSVRLVRLATGEVRTLGFHEHHVRAVAFSPDGKTLASGSLDHTIRLWNVETGTGQVIDASGNGITEIVFLPAGDVFASLGAEPSVRLWETATGKARTVLRGHGGSVESISISPDGRRITTASQDATIRIWDLASHESRSLKGHTAGVQWVAFSPDARTLVSASKDKTVRLWADDLPEDEAGLRTWLDAATPDKVDIDNPDFTSGR